MAPLHPIVPLPKGQLLAGKVVVVTGASRGIGRACILACANQGADVIIHHFGDELSSSEVKQMQEEIKSTGQRSTEVSGDISSPETAKKIVEAAVQAFGRIDVLVSNAGICPFHTFLDMPHSLWKKVQEVNIDGAFYITQAVANQMSIQTPKGGSIVAISSISALVGGAEQTHYTPTKAGIKSLMESCAVALGPMNIRCNSVLPGTVATAINTEDLADPIKNASMSARTCLGRLGEPDDIAGPVVFFASDLSRYCTGSSLLADGGLFVNLQ